MPVINIAYVFWEGVKFVWSIIRRGAYIGVLTLFFSSIFAMFTSYVVMFFYFYGIMQNLINYLSSPASSGSTYVSQMFGFLNCVGFTPALNDAKPVLLSGIGFLFGRIVFNISLRAYRYLLQAVTPLLTA